MDFENFIEENTINVECKTCFEKFINLKYDDIDKILKTHKNFSLTELENV